MMHDSPIGCGPRKIRDGKDRGAWEWPDFQLDPWATANSPSYGTALAALAVGTASAEYQRRPQIGQQLNAMTEYLQREAPTQSLHNRLTLLWAASKLLVALPRERRRLIMDEVLVKQQADGGWTMESLGPWKAPHRSSTSRGKQRLCHSVCSFHTATGRRGAFRQGGCPARWSGCERIRMADLVMGGGFNKRIIKGWPLLV